MGFLNEGCGGWDIKLLLSVEDLHKKDANGAYP